MANENSNEYGGNGMFFGSLWAAILALFSKMFGGSEQSSSASVQQDSSRSAIDEVTNTDTDSLVRSDGEKAKVEQVSVLHGEKLLSTSRFKDGSTQLTDEEKASIKGKFFMEAMVDGRSHVVEIDQATFERVEKNG